MQNFGHSWTNLTENSGGAIASFWDFDWGASLHHGEKRAFPDETIFATVCSCLPFYPVLALLFRIVACLLQPTVAATQDFSAVPPCLFTLPPVTRQSNYSVLDPPADAWWKKIQQHHALFAAC